eukprot:6213799-Pleurochrysis_carterae.AAC.1
MEIGFARHTNVVLGAMAGIEQHSFRCIGTCSDIIVSVLSLARWYGRYPNGKIMALVAHTGSGAVTDHDLDAPVVCIF